MKLTILGCHAATPSSNGNPTSQVLEINNQLVLIDCGEGTQVALRRNKIKFSKINHIFISHLHGDHFYGLIGFLSTLSLLKREKDLHIYGPVGLKEIMLLQLKLSKSWTTYDLKFHELSGKESERIVENKYFTVDTIPLKHRIYTNGFLFREQVKDRPLLIEKALNYNIDKSLYRSIKKGKDVTLDDGTIISNAELTGNPPEPKSYAYCSDTKYTETIIPIIKKVSLLYHEATFLERHLALAEITKHTTAIQAAILAAKSQVGQLILGHYSARYDNLQEFLDEAQPHFEQTQLAQDGMRINF